MIRTIVSFISAVVGCFLLMNSTHNTGDVAYVFLGTGVILLIFSSHIFVGGR